MFNRAGQQFGQGIGGLFGGLFGNGGKPYGDAMDQYKKYFGQAADSQNPFLNAGTGAVSDYQKWLGGMSNPSDFINNLMKQYQESPNAHNLQEQSMHAGQNAASANGLSGSTPFLQQAQENSGNIASNDMNGWLQNVLGINNSYGSGLNSLIGTGQNSANQLTNLYQKLGEMMGQGAYGKSQSENNRYGDIFGGLGNIIGSFF